MRAFFGLIGILVLILLAFSGLGIGFGLLVCWLIPAIDVGTGVLIGVISVGGTIHFYGHIIGIADAYEPPVVDEEEDEEASEFETVVLRPVRPRRRPRRNRK